MDILGLNPGSIDMIFLSHCHYDHTQGLVDMLKAIHKIDIPIVAHPDIFRKNLTLKPSIRSIGVIGENTRENIENEGGELLLIDSTFSLMNGVISTEEINDRLDFENPGVELYNIDSGKIEKDEVKDDISLVLQFSDGIVVISGCSHAGIVSIVRKAMEITDKSEVKAVIGGYHLINATDERIERTVSEFQEIGVNKIYTGHCTGLKAEYAFRQNWKEDFEKLHCGERIEMKSEEKLARSRNV